MKSLRIFLFLLFLACTFLNVNAAGRVFFVSPTGLSTNDGSQSKPWDLQTALNYRPTIVSSGDTIFLRGGVYKGNFVSFLVGAPGNPITVRSFPGEWAIIDANQPLTLAEAVGTGTGTFKLTGTVNLPNTVVVMVDGEHIKLTNKNGNTFTINARGWDGTIAVSHAIGRSVRAATEILTINGSDVIFGSFEVTDSKIDRILTVPGSNAVDFNRRYTGINNFAPRSKIINTIVHDTGQGIGFWSQAVDSEVYGNISYNNGEQAPDRGHGHGIYTQNSVGRKIVENNLTFGNFGGYGMQVYGSSTAQLRGYTISSNINFGNLYLVGGNSPADDIVLTNNYLFGTGLQLGYGNPNNGAITVNNNYVYATTPVELQWWQQVTMTGNRFYQYGSSSGTDSMITLPSGLTNVSQYKINNNSYIFGRSFQDRPFYLNNSGVKYYSFDQWKSLGLDTNSSWQGATANNTRITTPSGVDIFYSPNKYERGTAFVVIYNYDKVSSVRIDPSKAGLAVGQKFEIRNATNLQANPLYAGLFSGGSTMVSLLNQTISQPTGNTTIRNPEISPLFYVLLIRAIP